MCRKTFIGSAVYIYGRCCLSFGFQCRLPAGALWKKGGKNAGFITSSNEDRRGPFCNLLRSLCSARDFYRYKKNGMLRPESVRRRRYRPIRVWQLPSSPFLRSQSVRNKATTTHTKMLLRFWVELHILHAGLPGFTMRLYDGNTNQVVSFSLSLTESKKK